MNEIRPRTRNAIIEAAFQVFGANPGAALSEVAERAGVGRATLHRHFKGRDDLMVALARTAVRELDAAVDAAVADAPSHTEALRRSFQAIIPLASRQWFLAQEPVETDAGVKADHERQMREVAAEIDAAKREGTFAPDVPTAWIARAYDNLIFAAWETVHAGDATPSQAAALAWRTLTSGLGDAPHDQ